LHPVDAVRQRDPAAGDRRGARAAVGLDHVAVDRGLPFAERRQVDDRAQAAADQPLDFQRAAALLAGGGLAPRALVGGARQHAVFGRDPAACLSLEPWRQAVFQRRRHQHMGVAELHEAGAFGVFHHAAVERDGAQFVGLSAARPHSPSKVVDELAPLLGGAGRNDKACVGAVSGTSVASVMEQPVSQEIPLGQSQAGLAQLNERARESFRKIVESYLATGEPVGSRNLARLIPMTLSPASVRNVMADLEQLALVYAPHTSAGRLPTERGLRFFVDALMQVGDVTERDRQAIEAQVAAAGTSKSVDAVLTEASGLLSGLTRAAGVVLAVKSNTRLKHIEFVRLEPERALVVLVAEDGQVENRVLALPPGLPSSALSEATNFLNARIRGRTLAEARAELERALEAGKAELDQLTQRLVAAGLA